MEAAAGFFPAAVSASYLNHKDVKDAKDLKDIRDPKDPKDVKYPINFPAMTASTSLKQILKKR